MGEKLLQGALHCRNGRRTQGAPDGATARWLHHGEGIGRLRRLGEFWTGWPGEKYCSYTQSSYTFEAFQMGLYNFYIPYMGLVTGKGP